MAKLDDEFTMTTGSFSIDYETKEIRFEIEFNPPPQSVEVEFIPQNKNDIEIKDGEVAMLGGIPGWPTDENGNMRSVNLEPVEVEIGVYTPKTDGQQPGYTHGEPSLGGVIGALKDLDDYHNAPAKVGEKLREFYRELLAEPFNNHCHGGTVELTLEDAKENPDFFVHEFDPGDMLALATVPDGASFAKSHIDTQKYPHKCDCGAPSWNGLKVECSNPECMHFDGRE
jgi:hypothetical protein